MRYLQPIMLQERVMHERLARICHVDYDREIALVAEKSDEAGERQVMGIVQRHGLTAMAEQLHLWIRDQGRRLTEIIGPVPCFFSRLAGLYRWQIVLRGPDPASLLRSRDLGEWRVESDPPSLL